jgi:hypothetical protein
MGIKIVAIPDVDPALQRQVQFGPLPISHRRKFDGVAVVTLLVLGAEDEIVFQLNPPQH